MNFLLNILFHSKIKALYKALWNWPGKGICTFKKGQRLSLENWFWVSAIKWVLTPANITSSESITSHFALFYPIIPSPRQAKATARIWHHVHSVRAVAGVEQGSGDWRGQNPLDTRGKIISVDCLTLKALPAVKFRTLAMPRHLLRQAQLQLTFQIHSIRPIFWPFLVHPSQGINKMVIDCV